MADSILKIRTQDGDKPIGYPGLADKPVANKTLDTEGAFADAKVVGDKFKEVKAETDSLKEDIGDIYSDGVAPDTIDAEMVDFIKLAIQILLFQRNKLWLLLRNKEVLQT